MDSWAGWKYDSKGKNKLQKTDLPIEYVTIGK